MQCPRCGERLATGASACTRCGTAQHPPPTWATGPPRPWLPPPPGGPRSQTRMVVATVLGQVVGVADAIRTDAQGIGFAVPATTASGLTSTVLQTQELATCP